MAWQCNIGFHEWDGCQCSRCGKQRDCDHPWVGCQCPRCGSIRDAAHNWSGWRCTVCKRLDVTRANKELEESVKETYGFLFFTIVEPRGGMIPVDLTRLWTLRHALLPVCTEEELTQIKHSAHVTHGVRARLASSSHPDAGSSDWHSRQNRFKDALTAFLDAAFSGPGEPTQANPPEPWLARIQAVLNDAAPTAHATQTPQPNSEEQQPAKIGNVKVLLALNQKTVDLLRSKGVEWPEATCFLMAKNCGSRSELQISSDRVSLSPVSKVRCETTPMYRDKGGVIYVLFEELDSETKQKEGLEFLGTINPKKYAAALCAKFGVTGKDIYV